MSENPKTLGPYRILESLDRSGSGALYSAVGRSGGGMVLLEVLSSRSVIDPARLDREAAALRALSHPNVLLLLDVGRADDETFLVHEFWDGKPLETLLKRRRLSLQEAIAIWKGICRGLQHAHARGVLHHDLAPRTVFASNDLQNVKLIGFGIGRSDTTSSLSGTIATSDLKFGSVYYQAPEALENADRLDVRSNIYSAGAIFHEMLTGRSPGATFGLPSQLNSEVPGDLDSLVLRCLARNPAERPTSIGEVLQELERLEEGLRLRLLSEIRGFQTMQLTDDGKKKTRLWAAVGGGFVLLAIVFWLLSL